MLILKLILCWFQRYIKTWHLVIPWDSRLHFAKMVKKWPFIWSWDKVPKTFFSCQKQFFLILVIIVRIWVNIHEKILIRYWHIKILAKSADFRTFCTLARSVYQMIPIFCQNVLNRSPNTVTERYLDKFFFFRAKI